ncbi:conserved membrane hypothetical protein [Flavobacterium sp. 9AF]|nr:conserved membrane hypothetical protein [Flavobacterium sp. 9AF]
MEDYKNKIIYDGKFARFFALGSFIIGSVLFLVFTITHYEILIVIGFYYVIIAFFLNLILLLNTIYNLIVYKHLFLFQLGTILILLLNIPISIFYVDLLLNNLNINL